MTKFLKCNTCDWKTVDFKNISGAPREHLTKIHGYPATKADWKEFYTEVEIPDRPRIKCPYCDWSTLDVDNKSGWLTIHLKECHEKTPVETCLEFPEYTEYWSHIWKVEKHREFIQLSEDNHIECALCGGKFLKISNTHLKNKHGITQTEYERMFPGSKVMSKYSAEVHKRNYYNNTALLNSTFLSNGQRELYEFVKSYFPDAIQHRRYDNVEIDIFIPSAKIGIEYNGLYWHSEIHGGKSKNYHLQKTKYAESNGIHLIHVFEDEWLNKQSQVKSRLLSIFKINHTRIYARKCTVTELDKNSSATFFKQNHLQGNTGCLVVYGMYHNKKLIAAMSFGKLRSSLGYTTDAESSNIYELVRYAVVGGVSCVGAAGKLLSAFERKYHPSLVVSYADRRYTSNIKENLYTKIGFCIDSITKPNYWYMKSHVYREHRFKYAKHRIKIKFGISQDDSRTEFSIMSSLGYDRIWDCGSLKYIKTY